MREKRTFTLIFALLAVLLAVLPFLVTFNDALTKLVEKFNLYLWVQEKVVPVEVRMVGVLVRPLGVNYVAFFYWPILSRFLPLSITTILPP